MRLSMKYGLGSLLLCLLAVPAWAQEELDDVTMEVVEDADADESEYVEEIILPADAASEGAGTAGLADDAAPEAQDNAAFGMDTADRARALEGGREAGRAFGEDTADKARSQGRDAANAAKAEDGETGGPPENLPVQVQ